MTAVRMPCSSEVFAAGPFALVANNSQTSPKGIRRLANGIRDLLRGIEQLPSVHTDKLFGDCDSIGAPVLKCPISHRKLTTTQEAKTSPILWHTPPPHAFASSKRAGRRRPPVSRRDGRSKSNPAKPL